MAGHFLKNFLSITIWLNKGPSSIVIMNLGDIVHRVLEIIKQLDECIEATIDVHGNSNPTGGASAQHH
ncbi:unnamed protein product [Rotaria magnacalcarata]|nr:unnamed protein product [Rotaria magnacalcarata]CAF2117271.1 unnamed protein product [Rotaria magnacalcarata]